MHRVEAHDREPSRALLTDISTLARQAGVFRATLYRSYPHLKKQFEQDIAALQSAGNHADPRDAQIAVLGMSRPSGARVGAGLPGSARQVATSCLS